MSSKLKESYVKPRQEGCFGIKPSEAKAKIEQLGEDLHWLAERFENAEAVREMRSYVMLRRVLREHCEVVEGEAHRLRVKEPRELSAGYQKNIGQKPPSPYLCPSFAA